MNDAPYLFGFSGFMLAEGREALRAAGQPDPPEPECPSPLGHLYEQQATVLLSNPPQSVWCCVRDGCRATRHVLQPRPKPPQLDDEQLDAVQRAAVESLR